MLTEVPVTVEEEEVVTTEMLEDKMISIGN